MLRFVTRGTVKSLNSWIRQRNKQLFRSAVGHSKPAKTRSRRRLEVECLETRTLLSSLPYVSTDVLYVPTDQNTAPPAPNNGNPLWANDGTGNPVVGDLTRGLNTDPVANPNWSSDIANGVSGRLSITLPVAGTNDVTSPYNIVRSVAITAGAGGLAGAPGSYVEWRPVLAANGGIDSNFFSNLDGGSDQWDKNLVAISGTVINPKVSNDDLNVTHPFGPDAEFSIVPDNPQYLSLFAPLNYTMPGGVAASTGSDVAGLQDHDYATAIQLAQQYFSAPIAAATEAGNTVTITTTAAHNFSANQPVTIGGVGVAGYNGAFTITSVTPTTFTYTDPTAGLAPSGSVAIAAATEVGTTVTITTTAPHNLSVGDLVEITGVGEDGYNGAYTITSIPTPTTFTYADLNRGPKNTDLPASGGGTPTSAALGVPGVLGVETDNGLLPGMTTPAGYGPQATGDSVAVWGRWIVDAGHPDFHTEIHPPLLVASAHSVPDLTDSTVVGRPYLVDQLGWQTSDGVMQDGGVFDHTSDEVRKVFGNGNFLGIPSSTELEAHPNLLPTFAPGDTQLKVMDYVVQAPPAPPNAAADGDRLIANMSLTVRDGISVTVTPLAGQNAVEVRVTMNPRKYTQPPPPSSDATYFDQQLVNGAQGGVLFGSGLLGEILNSTPDGLSQLIALGSVINATQALARGIKTDLYSLTPPASPSVEIPFDTLPGNAVVNAYATMNDNQPFPIIGRIQLFWTNKPTIADEYGTLGANSSFLGSPVDANGNVVLDQHGNPVTNPVINNDPTNPLISYAQFQRGIMYFTPETGAMAIGATQSGSVAPKQLGPNPVISGGGTVIIRGSPSDDSVTVKSVAIKDTFTDPETKEPIFNHFDDSLKVVATFPQISELSNVELGLTFNNADIDSGPNINDPTVLQGSDAPDHGADAASAFTGINFASFSTATGDQGNDTFTNDTSIPSSVTAGAGTDTFVDQTGHGSLSGPDSSTTWEITGVNSGTYADGAGASGTFTGFANLFGDSAADTFQFGEQGSVANIDGGGGAAAANTLDYSTYSGPVNVSLQTLPGGPGIASIIVGTATGVTHLVTDIQTVIGSPLGLNTIAGAQQAVFPLTTATLPPVGTAIDGSQNAHATLVGDNAANNWAITGEGSGNVNGTLFKGFDDFEGASVTDTFVLSAGQTGGLARMQIHGNGGDNSLTLDFSNGDPIPLGGLVFAGGGGNNQLILQGGATSSISYTATGPAAGNIVDNSFIVARELDYSGVQSVVDQVTASSRSFVDNATGQQVIRLADDADAQGLTAIDSNGTGAFARVFFAAPTGQLSIQGGADDTTFKIDKRDRLYNLFVAGGASVNTLDYSDFPTGVAVNIPASTATGTSGIKKIQNVIGSHFDDSVVGVPSSVVNGNGGNDSLSGAGLAYFQLNAALPPAAPINGSGNTRSVVGLVGGVKDSWIISSLGAGTVDGIRFSGITDLFGGTGDNAFQFAAGAGVTGVVSGGGGTNTLDYSKQTTGVAVNLASGSATGTGGIRNIQSVIGSPFANQITSGGSDPHTFFLRPTAVAGTVITGNGSDTLVGADSPNMWTIAGNGSGTLNGISFSGIKHIVGGTVSDVFKVVAVPTVPITLDGNGGQETLIGPDTPSAWNITGANAGSLGTLTFSQVQNLTGGSANDQFVFTGNASVSGTIHGGGGNNALTLNDQNAPASENYIVSSAALSRGNPAQAVATYSGIQSVIVNSAIAGGNFDVSTIAKGTSVTLNAGGNVNTISVGGDSHTLGGIQGLLNVSGATAESTTVTLEDQASTVGRRFLVSNNQVNLGLGQVDFSGIENLVLDGGTAANGFVLLSTPAGLTTTVNAGPHGDTVTAGSSVAGNVGAIQGPLVINGQANTILPRFTVFDQAASTPQTYTLAEAGAGEAITRSGGLVATCNSIKSLTVNGGSGGNQFVDMVLPTSLVTFNGGRGSNALAATQGAGAITTWVISGAGSGRVGNDLVFTSMHDLVGTSNVDNFKFLATGSIAGTVAGSGGPGNLLGYANETGPVTVNLRTGAAPQINGGAPGGFSGITSVQGSASSSNTLIGPNGDTTWTIKAANGGSGSAGNLAFEFSQFQNLVGGGGVNVFQFTAGGRLSGGLNGGRAPEHEGNWLDYSALATPVTVNLQTGSATGVAGVVSNIQNVHGGKAGNTLTGNRQGNILIGGAGSDRITGGAAASLLIGDLGADTIIGGSGGDILIGDATIFDIMTAANRAALMAILAEWQSPDSYATRFTDIDTGTGGGLNRTVTLNFGTTVRDDGAADTVTAAASTAALDWFFAGKGDVLHNGEPGEHINNNTPAAFKDRTVAVVIPDMGLVMVSGTITDPDPGDPFVLTVNWGDGTPADTYTFPPGSDGQRVSVAHQYRHSGSYAIALSWTDPTGPANHATLAVRIALSAPLLRPAAMAR